MTSFSHVPALERDWCIVGQTRQATSSRELVSREAAFTPSTKCAVEMETPIANQVEVQ